ncbi:hypothetical protein B0H11DRAFT_2363831 [Mycena galericulata]|nr:hypothetical protein B0H11DRAFT_2363831 [Mycena galericulata]
MSDSHLDWIWSLYTTSPDPASGMSTLRDTCVALLNYPLTSSSFIPAIAGLALHPSVAEPFREVFPILKHLMYSAVQHHSTSQPLFDHDHADFRLVTILGVRRDDAEAAWGRLLRKVAAAMGYIEELYALVEMSVSAQGQTAKGTHFPSTVLPLSSRGPPRGRLAAPSIVSETKSIVHSSRPALAPRLPAAFSPSSSRRSRAHSTSPVGQFTLRREFPSRQAGRTVEEFHDMGATGRVEKSAGYVYAVNARTRTMPTSQSAGDGLAEAHGDVPVEHAGMARKDSVDTGHMDNTVSEKGEDSTRGRTQVLHGNLRTGKRSHERAKLYHPRVDAYVAGTDVEFTRVQHAVVDAEEALRNTPRAAQRVVHLDFKQGAHEMSENSGMDGLTEVPLEHQRPRKRVPVFVNARSHAPSSLSEIGAVLGAESPAAESGGLEEKLAPSDLSDESPVCDGTRTIPADSAFASATADVSPSSMVLLASRPIAISCIKTDLGGLDKSVEDDSLAHPKKRRHVDFLHSDPVCKLGIMRMPVHSHEGGTFAVEDETSRVEHPFPDIAKDTVEIEAEGLKESEKPAQSSTRSPSKGVCTFETFTGIDEDSGVTNPRDTGDACTAVDFFAAARSDHGDYNADTSDGVGDPGVGSESVANGVVARMKSVRILKHSESGYSHDQEGERLGALPAARLHECRRRVGCARRVVGGRRCGVCALYAE